MNLFTIFAFMICFDLSHELVFKQIINVRSVLYEKFHNVDYKIISLPENLIDLTISIKFIKWIGFLPLCPKKINITAVFQYGTFPLFKFDSKFEKNFNNSQYLKLAMLHPEVVNDTHTYNLKSPRSGPWFWGSIFDSHDDFDHFIICSAALRVKMVGLQIHPLRTVLISKNESPQHIQLSLNESQNFLLEIKSPEPLRRLKITLLCPACTLIVSVASHAVPEMRTVADARQHHELFKSKDVILDIWQPEVDLRLLLQIRVVFGPAQGVVLIVDHEPAQNSTDLTFLDPATFVKADAMFAYRFSPSDLESATIPIVLKDGKIFVQAFYIDPIRDQGGVLSIDLKLSTDHNGSLSNGSLHLCISNIGFSRRDDLLSASSTSDQCRGSVLALTGPQVAMNEFFYFPRWGWWYVTMMLDSRDGHIRWKAELGISSRRCKAGNPWCNGNGICLLNAVDNGLMSSCHCFKSFYGLDCLGKHLPNRMKIEQSIYKRNWLVLSNLAFIPAVIVSIVQRVYLLSIIYIATAGFSMVHHSCSIEDSYIKYCVLSVEQLAFYDHFAAVLCVWASIVTMTTLSSKIQSMLNISMIFVIIVMAHIIQRSVWLYAVPIIAGMILIIVCWSYRMYHLKCIFPPIDWWVFGLIPGFTLVMAAFVSFRRSIHQEYQYYLYHSAWHILIALSICFILPNTRRWRKALKSSRSGNLVEYELIIHSQRWRKLKKTVNYYLHLDALINLLILHNPRCSFLKSY